jgi:hypothetical protein
MCGFAICTTYLQTAHLKIDTFQEDSVHVFTDLRKCYTQYNMKGNFIWDAQCNFTQSTYMYCIMS